MRGCMLPVYVFNLVILYLQVSNCVEDWANLACQNNSNVSRRIIEMLNGCDVIVYTLQVTSQY